MQPSESLAEDPLQSATTRLSSSSGRGILTKDRCVCVYVPLSVVKMMDDDDGGGGDGDGECRCCYRAVDLEDVDELSLIDHKDIMSLITRKQEVRARYCTKFHV